MAKLALVNPGRRIEYVTNDPLNLEYIAAYVKKHGIEVKIIDELAFQNVQLEILKYKPDIVGITGTTPVILDTYRIADMCRKMGIRTVIGGVHATVMPEEALQHADIVVKGEGEIAMLNIIQQDIKSGIVEGIPIKNLDDIPLFDKSELEMDFYIKMSQITSPTYESNGIPAAMMITSRGCSNKCAFCHNSWYGLPYRCNSINRVITEIRYLNQIYGIGLISFYDDDLFMNKPRINLFCHRLIESEIPIVWSAMSRVDNLDIETLKLAKQAGCIQIQFGFESGSQRMLDSFNKKITIEQSVEAIRMCHEVGIPVWGFFMIGCPNETVEDVRMTQQFIKNNPMEMSVVSLASPFPGTKWWDWCKERGLIPEHIDWSDFILNSFDYKALSKHIFACDTIPVAQLVELYKEMQPVIPKGMKRVDAKWLINMCTQHPIKSINLATRISLWSRYLDRIKK